ncbi:hypothetical protein QFZ30_000352 [Arthrobacter pascens]|nr:hypothetical protein [Arthrobacter pascens]
MGYTLAAYAFAAMKSRSSLDSTICPCLSRSMVPPAAILIFADTVRGRIWHPGFSASHLCVVASSLSHSSLMHI